jgi:hypothetical protein
MPKLSYAFLADHVRAEGGIAHIIGAGIDTVWATKVPTGQNLGIVARLAFTHQECGRPHRVEIIFQNEDGVRLAQIQAIVTPERVPDLPVHWEQGWLAGINVGLPIPAYGIYAFEVMVNDENRTTLNLRVKPASERPGSKPAPDEPSSRN